MQLHVTNNEGEYEALIATLQTAISRNIKNLIAKNDSQVIVRHVNQTYVVKETNMQLYLVKLRTLMRQFHFVKITHIPRSLNTEVYTLSKLKAGEHIEGQWMQPLMQKSITELVIVFIEVATWMSPIIQYIKDGTLPNDSVEAKKTKTMSLRYTLISDQLYHQAFSWPLLKCVTEDEGNYILREIREGICGAHIDAKSLTHKIMRIGYFCPTMEVDTTTFF